MHEFGIFVVLIFLHIPEDPSRISAPIGGYWLVATLVTVIE